MSDLKTRYEQILAEQKARWDAGADKRKIEAAAEAAADAHHKALVEKLPAVGLRPKCRQCGKELAVFQFYGHPSNDPDATRIYGYQGNNVFCTLRCGYWWALRRAA